MLSTLRSTGHTHSRKIPVASYGETARNMAYRNLFWKLLQTQFLIFHEVRTTAPGMEFAINVPHVTVGARRVRRKLVLISNTLPGLLTTHITNIRYYLR